MKFKPMPHADELRRLFSYDPKTGVITRIHVNSGARSRVDLLNRPIKSTLYNGGYLRAGAYGYQYYAHRLAWKIYHGEEPPDVIDHINGDRTDNRIANLRACTQANNTMNSQKRVAGSSGFKGVGFFKQTGMWRARIMVNRKETHIGLFSTEWEAHLAYCEASSKIHGQFANSGRKYVTE